MQYFNEVINSDIWPVALLLVVGLSIIAVWVIFREKEAL